MDIDLVLIDLNVISQLKDHDKLGVNILPGKKELVIFSGKAWLQGPYRWYYGCNRADVIDYLHQLAKRVERHALLFSDPTDKTKTLREHLKNNTLACLDGIQQLRQTYQNDNNMVAQLILVSAKLQESANSIHVID